MRRHDVVPVQEGQDRLLEQREHVEPEHHEEAQRHAQEESEQRADDAPP